MGGTLQQISQFLSYRSLRMRFPITVTLVDADMYFSTPVEPVQFQGSSTHGNQNLHEGVLKWSGLYSTHRIGQVDQALWTSGLRGSANKPGEGFSKGQEVDACRAISRGCRQFRGHPVARCRLCDAAELEHPRAVRLIPRSALMGLH